MLQVKITKMALKLKMKDISFRWSDVNI